MVNKEPEEWEKEFDEKLGTYTNEYGYIHKIPNSDKIKSFIRDLLSKENGYNQAVKEAAESVEDWMFQETLKNKNNEKNQ